MSHHGSGTTQVHSLLLRSSPTTSLQLQFGPIRCWAQNDTSNEKISAKNCLLIEFLQLHKGKKRLCKELITNYCRNQIAMKTIGKKLQIKAIKQRTLTMVFFAEGKLDNKTQLPAAQTPTAELKEVKA